MIILVGHIIQAKKHDLSMLRSDLCNYFDAYILVKGTITVGGPNNKTYKKLALKNNALFY